MGKPAINTNLAILPCNCKCSVNVDPCNCNKAAVSVQCRTRSGGYALCGFEEFGTPSNPPKRYRRWTITGTWQHKVYGQYWECNDATTHQLIRYTNSGAAFYANAPGCALTDQRRVDFYTETFDQNTGQTTSSSSTTLGRPGYIGSPYSTCNGTKTETKTTRRHKANNVCCPAENDLARFATGDVSETLSVEDTESDAIARAARSVAWSDWFPCPCTCCAWRTKRGAGALSGSWQEAELKFTAKGSPGATAVIEVTLVQRPLAGGVASTSKELYTIYCDGAGDGEVTISVPSASGSEVCYSGLTQIK